VSDLRAVNARLRQVVADKDELIASQDTLIRLKRDQFRQDRNLPYKARVRWIYPSTKDRKSKSESFVDNDSALAWIDQMQKAAAGGIDPNTATMPLAEYGKVNWDLAVRGLEKRRWTRTARSGVSGLCPRLAISHRR
jgi:hypothetical protein